MSFLVKVRAILLGVQCLPDLFGASAAHGTQFCISSLAFLGDFAWFGHTLRTQSYMHVLIADHCVGFCYVRLTFTFACAFALHYIALDCITLHCVALRCIAYIHTYSHMYVCMDRQPDRQTDSQTDRQTNRQTYSIIHTWYISVLMYIIYMNINE